MTLDLAAVVLTVNPIEFVQIGTGEGKSVTLDLAAVVLTVNPIEYLCSNRNRRREICDFGSRSCGVDCQSKFKFEEELPDKETHVPLVLC